MSRIGKQPVEILSGVKVELKGQHVKVAGPKGNSEMDVHPMIKVELADDGKAINLINEKENDRVAKQLHGTMRALIANMVNGAGMGFEKKMQIFGTGFNIAEQGGSLVLNVGFSHPVKLSIPKSVKVNIEVKATRGNDVPAVFTLVGHDKCELGQFAADIRKVRPPEPYKGKGIRYADEVVRRKVGKAFASGSA